MLIGLHRTPLDVCLSRDHNPRPGGRVVKYTIPVLLLVLAVGAVAGAQKDQARQGSDAATRALVDVENKCVEALVKSDIATLDSIFADTYVDTDERSRRSGKEDVFSFLKSGDLKLDSIKLSDMQVHLYGDAAVVTGSAVQVGSLLGGPIATNVIFTDTFVRQNGKWRAVASHRSVAAA
jgi:ketosteroid isomerase-like protein